jgi:hypothetical protein
MAPLCIDLKELPTPETLHARMTSIALENGLLGGVGEDVVNVMLFAAEVSCILLKKTQDDSSVLEIELHKVIHYKRNKQETSESMHWRKDA